MWDSQPTMPCEFLLTYNHSLCFAHCPRPFSEIAASVFTSALHILPTEFGCQG